MELSGLITLIIVLVIIGVCLYLLETLPISAPIKVVIRVVVVLGCVLYLLRAFGVMSGPLLR